MRRSCKDDERLVTYNESSVDVGVPEVLRLGAVAQAARAKYLARLHEQVRCAAALCGRAGWLCVRLPGRERAQPSPRCAVLPAPALRCA